MRKLSAQIYARYALCVLLLVNILSLVDRQILAILAEPIKADLGLSDASVGILYGVSFAVFNATFGIPLGRIADSWNRKSLIAIGLGVWSIMTTLCGLASGFVSLALCRFGVGIGEASATPASYSILYDYFPPKVRTTAVGVLSSGLYIGSGLGLFIGGWVLGFWHTKFPDVTSAPFGLHGWQVAFMVVGAPGIVMALWVSTIREPVRGQMDGILAVTKPHPFREAIIALTSMLPIINLLVVSKEKRSWPVYAINTIITLGTICCVVVLFHQTHAVLLAATIGVGLYAVLSWLQFIALRDPVVFGLIFRSKAVTSIILAGAGIAFMQYSLVFWSVPLFERQYGIGAAEIGRTLGLGNALIGTAGVILGGVISDRLRVHSANGKMYVVIGSVAASILSALVLLSTTHLSVSYIGLCGIYFFYPMGVSPITSTLCDLVIPRSRATLFAFCSMFATFVALGVGPYVIGQISDAIASGGVSSGESLRRAMLWTLLVPVAGAAFSIRALIHIKADEASLVARARLLGEDI